MFLIFGFGISFGHGARPIAAGICGKNGSRFWTDGVMMRLDHENGDLRGLAKIARDATEEWKAAEALRHAHDELEQRVVERTAEFLEANNQLQRTIRQRKQLERELLEIGEREKRRIGEDLHDMICQELAATALLLKSTANKLGTESPAAAEILNESAQTVNRNVELARELARDLQPAELTAAGLSNALRTLAAQASETKEINCQCKASHSNRWARRYDCAPSLPHRAGSGEQCGETFGRKKHPHFP